MTWTHPSEKIRLLLLPIMFLVCSGCQPKDSTHSCEDYVGLATPAEIASSPRADPEMEMLAVSISGGLVAREQDYERISADVAAIRAIEPRVAAIHVFPVEPVKDMWLVVNDPTFTAIEAGSYHEWDCPNTLYGGVMLDASDSPGDSATALLEFTGVFDMDLLAGEYEELPGISDAGPDGPVGDGPTICVTAETSTFHYVFDDASGDCEAGCATHVYYYFTTEPGSAPIPIGEWSTDSTVVAPAWVESYACG